MIKSFINNSFIYSIYLLILIHKKQCFFHRENDTIKPEDDPLFKYLADRIANHTIDYVLFGRAKGLHTNIYFVMFDKIMNITYMSPPKVLEERILLNPLDLKTTSIYDFYGKNSTELQKDIENIPFHDIKSGFVELYERYGMRIWLYFRDKNPENITTIVKLQCLDFTYENFKVYVKSFFVEKPDSIFEETYLDSADNHPMAIYKRITKSEEGCKSKTTSILKYIIGDNWLKEAKVWKSIHICYHPPLVEVYMHKENRCNCTSEWLNFDRAIAMDTFILLVSKDAFYILEFDVIQREQTFNLSYYTYKPDEYIQIKKTEDTNILGKILRGVISDNSDKSWGQKASTVALIVLIVVFVFCVCHNWLLHIDRKAELEEERINVNQHKMLTHRNRNRRISNENKIKTLISKNIKYLNKSRELEIQKSLTIIGKSLKTNKTKFSLPSNWQRKRSKSVKSQIIRIKTIKRSKSEKKNNEKSPVIIKETFQKNKSIKKDNEKGPGIFKETIKKDIETTVASPKKISYISDKDSFKDSKSELSFVQRSLSS